MYSRKPNKNQAKPVNDATRVGTQVVNITRGVCMSTWAAGVLSIHLAPFEIHIDLYQRIER